MSSRGVHFSGNPLSSRITTMPSGITPRTMALLLDPRAAPQLLNSLPITAAPRGVKSHHFHRIPRSTGAISGTLRGMCGRSVTYVEVGNYLCKCRNSHRKCFSEIEFCGILGLRANGEHGHQETQMIPIFVRSGIDKLLISEGFTPQEMRGPCTGHDSSAGNAGFRGSEASHSPTGCADAAAQAGNTNDFPVVGSFGMAGKCPG